MNGIEQMWVNEAAKALVEAFEEKAMTTAELRSAASLMEVWENPEFADKLRLLADAMDKAKNL